MYANWIRVDAGRRAPLNLQRYTFWDRLTAFILGTSL